MRLYDIQDLVKRDPGQVVPANNQINLQIQARMITTRILATAAAFFILFPPSMVVTLILGLFVLKLPLTANPFLGLVLPMAGQAKNGLAAGLVESEL